MITLRYGLLIKGAGSLGGRILSVYYSSKPGEMEQETLYIKKLSENATTPVRGSPYSAGYDLFRLNPIDFCLYIVLPIS